MSSSSGSAAAARPGGFGSDAAMREVASKRSSEAAGLSAGGYRNALEREAAAVAPAHSRPAYSQLQTSRVPPPPPSASNKDSQRVLIFISADRSRKISGNQDIEDYMLMIGEEVTNISDKYKLKETMSPEDYAKQVHFDVRNAVHGSNTAIAVEFSERKMADEIRNHYGTNPLVLGFEHEIISSSQFFVELPPEELQKDNSNLILLYLRNILSIKELPNYTKSIAAHYGVAESDIKVESLHTQICGEKTKNCDGTVQFIFSNINNVQTYPAVPMLLDGEKVSTFSAARGQISVTGKPLCPDIACAAMGNNHKMGCKGVEFAAQKQQKRDHAQSKDFEKLLGANRAQAQGLRIGFKQAAMAKKMTFCKNFNAKAVPCQGDCVAYPCNDWEHIMLTELDGTFYTELPAFRWPKRRSKGTGKGAKERRALQRATGNGTIDEDM